MSCEHLHRGQRLVGIEEANTTLDSLEVAINTLRELVGEMVSDFGVLFEVGSIEEHQRESSHL